MQFDWIIFHPLSLSGSIKLALPAPNRHSAAMEATNFDAMILGGGGAGFFTCADNTATVQPAARQIEERKSRFIGQPL